MLWVFLAAGAGIYIDRVLAVSILVWGTLVCLSLVFFSVLSARRRDFSSGLTLLCGVAALAGIWHHDRWRFFPQDEIARYAAAAPLPVRVRVAVRDAPRWSPAAREGPLSTMTRGETTRVEVRVLALRQATHWQRASGHLTLLVEGHVEGLYRGDRLELAALLARIRGPLNPGEPDFAAMCRGRRQLAILLCEHPACVRRWEAGAGGSVLRQLGRLRLWAEGALDRFVGSRRSALAAALLLGTRERLDQETVQTFFLSGTLHLLAISGLHVGLLATVFWLLLRLDWFTRNQVLLATCILAICYALLTGARPPVVRATILIILYCLARAGQRSASPWNSLAAAGLFTLAVSPAGLFDTGTQLSFLAVATLISAWPAVSRAAPSDGLNRLVELSRPIWLRGLHVCTYRMGQLWLISGIVWLVSLPLVAYRFHLVTPVGPLLNVLLWAPVAVALFAALLVLVTAPLPGLPCLFGWLCDRMLLLIEFLTAMVADWSWGYSWVVGPPPWWVAGFYGALMVRQCSGLPIRQRWWCALLGGWLILGVACGSGAARAWRSATDQPLRLSFIAVGHGTSVLVELPGGRVLLYDAGRMGSPHAAALPISSVLWARRIRHLDAIVLSHADADHFNAVPELLDRFSVGVVYVSPVMFRADAPAVTQLRAAIDAANVPVGELQEQSRLCTGTNVAVEVLHPPPDGCTHGPAPWGDNANSIVLAVSRPPYRILLTGDLEQQGLDELLAELPKRCDVLMAPHHGSRHSRPADWVRWADPSAVVISAGTSLPWQRAVSDYGGAGAKVLWTHRDGLVEVWMTEHELKISTHGDVVP